MYPSPSHLQGLDFRSSQDLAHLPLCDHWPSEDLSSLCYSKRDQYVYIIEATGDRWVQYKLADRLYNLKHFTIKFVGEFC